MAISTASLSSDMTDEARNKFIQNVIAECDVVVKDNPDNRCAKYCKYYLGSDEGKGLGGDGACFDTN